METEPIGIEVQCLIWGYKTERLLQNVIFRKFTVINKSNIDLDSTFISYWSDIDIGDAVDDNIGCDPILGVGYIYNGKISDSTFGKIPPAVGYLLLQSPVVKSNLNNSIAKWNFSDILGYRNIGMTASTSVGPSTAFDWVPTLISYQYYYLMNGKTREGSQFIDRVTNLPTKFWFSGNPFTKTGFCDGMSNSFLPSNKRLLISSGPFRLAKKDAQEFIIAIIAGEGIDRLTSVNIMKGYCMYAYTFFNYGLSNQTEIKKSITTEFLLSQNYPNPFNSSTIIKFTILKKGLVTLSVFDILGREVETLFSRYKESGEYLINWNASKYSSGVYFYKLIAGDFIETRKMFLMK